MGTKHTIYPVYGGREELKYVVKGRSHWYEHRGKKMPNVTKITGLLGDPGPLMYWAVNCAIDHLQENLQPGIAVDEVEKDMLLEKAKFAHRNVSGKALSIGGQVHNWIEEYVKSRIAGQERGTELPMPSFPINNQVLEGVNGFLEWEKAHHVVYISSERRVLSIKHRFAGTMDIEARVDGELGIQDIKTSKAVYSDMFLQVAAYKIAAEEEAGQRNIYKNNNIIRVPKDGGELEVVPVGQIRAAEKGFLGCLAAYIAEEKVKKYLSDL